MIVDSCRTSLQKLIFDSKNHVYPLRNDFTRIIAAALCLRSIVMGHNACTLKPIPSLRTLVFRLWDNSHRMDTWEHFLAIQGAYATTAHILNRFWGKTAVPPLLQLLAAHCPRLAHLVLYTARWIELLPEAMQALPESVTHLGLHRRYKPREDEDYEHLYDMCCRLGSTRKALRVVRMLNREGVCELGEWMSVKRDWSLFETHGDKMIMSPEYLTLS
ncbi:hypothetical protein EVG20_g2049 [Dentipellis fragilis]|uniref:Uncharacterized protein n=1 Tax=Dentipellis fragilis TaxID=205917 RepID=A0A4Y9Z8U6_9AGAM|nr:hypothetical protein EVG20_g2049 [Dentipellis fragilis]